MTVDRWIGVCLVLFACSPDGGAGRSDGGGISGPENTPAACSDAIDNDGDGLSNCADPDCAPLSVCTSPRPDAARTDGFMECGGTTRMTDNLLAPVDIIWVVDSSDSMENDATIVQNNLDGFATYIESRTVDFHVVLISDRGFVTPSARFGTDPRFLFVDRGVGSNDAFDRLLDQFPTYSAHLRPTAITHVIGVTDDEENMGAATFISMMSGLLGHPFVYHAIASPPGECNSLCLPGCLCVSGAEGCGRPGELLPAAAPGEEHWAAAAATGGMTFSICTTDWSGLFDTLAMTVAVSMELPCVFDIPDPPAGMSFDRDAVNFEYTPEGGAARRLPRAPNEAACAGAEAWYYDNSDAPTAIMLCPAACASIMGGGGLVEVRFGCASMLI